MVCGERAVTLLKNARKVRNYKRLAAGLIVGPFVATLVYGAAIAEKDARLASTMAAWLSAAAPMALGGLMGFLFGIPRTFTSEGAAATTAGADAGGDARRPAPRRARHQVNTNLEQISDWLTKILVGVGLTQVGALPDELRSLAEYLAPAMTVHSGAVAVIVSVLVYFSVAGFLTGYLLTRLVLAPAFQETENAPDEAAVDRLANAPLPTAGAARSSPVIAQRDAAELLRFSLDELESPKERIAWGRAKLHVGEPEAAMRAIEKVVDHDPTDHRAVENLVFASLYADKPEGFERAIRYARDYLDQLARRRSEKDASLYAYLACAYGQAYAWEKENPSGRDLEQLRREALDAAKTAIQLAPLWKETFRALASPRPGSDEDDLAALADDPELRELLK